MKRNLITILAVLLAVTSILLSACAPAATEAPAPAETEAPAATEAPAPAETEAPAAEENVIKIGGLYPTTGDLAKLGQENVNGLQLAVDQINAAGGIQSMGGAKIEIVWGDTQGKPEVGISEVTRLVEQENVVAIIGAYQSGVTTPATQEAERLSTPFLVSMAVSDKITERGFKYTFRICPKASWYAKDQVTFLKDLKDLAGLEVKKVALLHEDTDFGESTAAGQKQYLEEAGMEMVLEVKYSASAADLTTEVSKVKAANPDAVLTVTYLNDSVLIARAREALGMMDIPFVDAAGGTVDPEFIKQLGATAEGWFTEIEFTKYAAGANVLNDAYKAQYGDDITGNGAYAYQAGWVIADALERAAAADRDAVRDALVATDMPSGPNMVLPTDKIYFDENGQNPNAPLFIVQVQNGELIPVWPGAYAAKPVVLTK
ncbi:MAG: ABC transporter substrate-binding protein [Chloroflexota bacterium]